MGLRSSAQTISESGLEREGGFLVVSGTVHADEVTHVGKSKLTVGVDLVAGINGVLRNRQIDRGVAGRADGCRPRRPFRPCRSR